jgi:hypothetical protein
MMRGQKVLMYEGHQFRKQTYRNRLSILTANGIQHLSIPLQHPISGIPYREIRIAYLENWQRRHLRAIHTAYGKSPFFFYWEQEIRALYDLRPEFLYEWNRACVALLSKMLKISLPEFSSEAPAGLRYEEASQHLLPIKPYLQTFHDRLPFNPAVSGLDLALNAP